MGTNVGSDVVSELIAMVRRKRLRGVTAGYYATVFVSILRL